MVGDVSKKLDLFFSKYKAQRYKKGAILIRADDEPSGVFYLKEGIVRSYAISPSGEELTLNVYRPVSFFPMSWVLNGTLSPHYYEALTPVTVWRAPKRDFLEFIKNENEVMLDLLSRIYKGLDGFFLRMEYLMSGSSKNRLVTELLILGRRFGKIKDGKTVVGLKLTEKDLASQSGIARETVSREISKLKELGLIDFKKNTLFINNLNGLEEELTTP